MDSYVVVATKGRPLIARELLDWLTEQTLQPERVMVVGSDAADVAGLETHPLHARGLVELSISAPGSCVQRNVGLDRVASHAAQTPHRPFFVAIFDDDFRPHRAWLAACRDAFLARHDAVGLTGRVLADGVVGHAITELEARGYVESRLAPTRSTSHQFGAATAGPIDTLYGCNMAFRDRVASRCRFDENLPLYGWQEDHDYSARASYRGRLLYEPACRGVHLGVKGGRTSGLRFGYSQVANPWYLACKGTLSVRKALRLVSRNFSANLVKSVTRPDIDYPGRLTGNLLALADLVRGKAHPTRVADL